MNDFAVLSTLVTDFRKELNALLAREATRHMMDCHLDFQTLDALEEHLIPALDAVEEALDWQPCDADLGGEPPLTAAEMHTAAWQQHQDTHN